MVKKFQGYKSFLKENRRHSCFSLKHCSMYEAHPVPARLSSHNACMQHTILPVVALDIMATQ